MVMVFLNFTGDPLSVAGLNFQFFVAASASVSYLGLAEVRMTASSTRPLSSIKMSSAPSLIRPKLRG